MKEIDIGFDIEEVAPNEQTKQWLKEEGFSGAFANLLNQGISSLYPQGVPMVKGRTLGRLQAKLRHMEVTTRVLAVEEAEYDLLKSVFLNDSTLFAWGQVELASMYADAVEAAATRKSPAKLVAIAADSGPDDSSVA